MTGQHSEAHSAATAWNVDIDPIIARDLFYGGEPLPWERITDTGAPKLAAHTITKLQAHQWAEPRIFPKVKLLIDAHHGDSPFASMRDEHVVLGRRYGPRETVPRNRIYHEHSSAAGRLVDTEQNQYAREEPVFAEVML